MSLFLVADDGEILVETAGHEQDPVEESGDEALILLAEIYRTLAELCKKIESAMVLGDVNWLAALSIGGFGFFTAILLALTGLPEVEKNEN